MKCLGCARRLRSGLQLAALLEKTYSVHSTSLPSLSDSFPSLRRHRNQRQLLARTLALPFLGRKRTLEVRRNTRPCRSFWCRRGVIDLSTPRSSLAATLPSLVQTPHSG